MIGVRGRKYVSGNWRVRGRTHRTWGQSILQEAKANHFVFIEIYISKAVRVKLKADAMNKEQKVKFRVQTQQSVTLMRYSDLIIYKFSSSTKKFQIIYNFFVIIFATGNLKVIIRKLQIVILQFISLIVPIVSQNTIIYYDWESSTVNILKISISDPLPL